MFLSKNNNEVVLTFCFWYYFVILTAGKMKNEK